MSVDEKKRKLYVGFENGDVVSGNYYTNYNLYNSEDVFGCANFLYFNTTKRVYCYA
jgi:hypothetical protein